MPQISNARDSRRTAILNAASELLARRPTASLAEIAEHAGVGKATLHRYFASRDDLMLGLGFRALEMVSQAIAACGLETGSTEEAFKRLSEALTPLGDKLHFLMSEGILDRHPDFLAADRQVEQPVLHLIRRGQAEGRLRDNLPAEWIMNVLNYALFATWQGVLDGYIARRDAPHLLFTTLMSGIASQ